MAITFFAGSSTEDELEPKDEATDSIAEEAAADVARLFRDRYADLPRIIRESRYPADAIAGIDAILDSIKSVDEIEQTLIANALNALA